MATETVNGVLVAEKAIYVKQSEPTRTFNEQIIYYNDDLSIMPMLWFDVSKIPKFATDIKIVLHIATSSEDDMLINKIYKLNSDFSDSTNYNNKPTITELRTITKFASPTFVIPLVTAYHTITLDDIKYGISFDSYNYCTCSLFGVTNVNSDEAPLIKYSYTKDDSTLTLTTNGTSIDDDINVSWTLENQIGAVVKAYQNNELVATNTATTANTVSFASGTFTTTEDITFVVEAYTNGTLYTKSITLKNVTNTVPGITNLEPSNVNKLKTNAIDVTFTGTNIDEWELLVQQNGVTKHSDVGTTARKSTIQANVLSSGTTTITITAIHYGNGYTTTTTQTATFNVYGKPEQPSITYQESYNTPYPKFSWGNNSEQIAWKFVISHVSNNATVIDIDTGEQYGTSNTYKCSVNLSNNTYYTGKLYIKNQYGLWSDPASVTFLVSFSELAQPTFTLYSDHGNAANVLVIESNESSKFSRHIVYRREVSKSEWMKIADNVERIQTVTDCECRSNVEYEYKVAVVSTFETYTDSEIKITTCNFHNTHISIANSNDKVVLDIEVNKNISYNDDITFSKYDGYSKPDSSDSGLEYATLSVSAEVDKVTYDKLMKYWKEPLLCLRDASGLLIYGRITKPKVNFQSYGYYVISFNFTECYNEGVDLNGNDEYRYCYFVEREW